VIKGNIRNFFFDRAVVINAMDKASVQALSKGGAFIMRAARTSMRWRTGTNKKGEARFGRGRKPKPASPPGAPPFAWKEQGQLRRLLFFFYDPRTKSVVVGPQKFGDGGVVPGLHEFGGTAKRRARGKSTRTVRYAPRPFMSPALAKETPRLPARWANSVKS
jgi:hypothetical protein